jgi:hypothetical protein
MVGSATMNSAPITPLAAKSQAGIVRLCYDDLARLADFDFTFRGVLTLFLQRRLPAPSFSSNLDRSRNNDLKVIAEIRKITAVKG